MTHETFDNRHPCKAQLEEIQPHNKLTRRFLTFSLTVQKCEITHIDASKSIYFLILCLGKRKKIISRKLSASGADTGYFFWGGGKKSGFDKFARLVPP